MVRFTRAIGSLTIAVVLSANAAHALAQNNRTRIDRHALVTRHAPHVTTVDPWASLTVGNGAFAFTADATGLQTLYPYYQAHGIALETEARWSWHSNPNPQHHSLSDANRPITAGGQDGGLSDERAQRSRPLVAGESARAAAAAGRPRIR